MRLGVMGGTFDPIHNGHLFIAEEARIRFRLDKVLFIPNGQPPHKRNPLVTPPMHRYAMTQIATHPNAAFACSPVELQRSGLSYTVETLGLLKREYPQDEIFYITGVDAVADILSWKRHEEVIQLATFIAATRPGFDPSGLKERLPVAYLERMLLLGTTAIGISSSEIRERLGSGLPVRYLLPDRVLEYIQKNRLYAPRPTGAAVPGPQAVSKEQPA